MLMNLLMMLINLLIPLVPDILIAMIPELLLIPILITIAMSRRSIWNLIKHCWISVSEKTKVYQTFTIPKFKNSNSRENPLYFKSHIYISTLAAAENSTSSLIYSDETANNRFTFQMADDHTIVDHFDGAEINWTKPSSGPDRLEIRIRGADRVRVLRPYLRYLEAQANRIEDDRAERTRGVPIPVNLPTLCGFDGLTSLASYYLGIRDHPLYEDIGELMLERARTITVADVADAMLANRNSPNRAIQRVVQMLREERHGPAERQEGGSRRFRKVKRAWGAVKRKVTSMNCF